MTVLCVFVGNTNEIELLGLKSEIEETFIDDAAVTVTVKDADGNSIAGQSWPATLTFVDGSEGDYRGTLEHDLDLEAGEEYVAHVDANAGANRRGHWEFAFTAKTRRAT
jgi:hypothetical protein